MVCPGKTEIKHVLNAKLYAMSWDPKTNIVQLTLAAKKPPVQDIS